MTTAALILRVPELQTEVHPELSEILKLRLDSWIQRQSNACQRQRVS